MSSERRLVTSPAARPTGLVVTIAMWLALRAAGPPRAADATRHEDYLVVNRHEDYLVVKAGESSEIALAAV